MKIANINFIFVLVEIWVNQTKIRKQKFPFFLVLKRQTEQSSIIHTEILMNRSQTGGFGKLTQALILYQKLSSLVLWDVTHIQI